MKLTLKKATEMMARNGGWLDLRGTGITALPDNLTVGGSLDLRGTGITNKDKAIYGVHRLHDGDYADGRYLYADGILTHIKRVKRLDGYTFYVGKLPGKNVVSDGKNYAHCNKFRDGIADLLFKSASDRGASQYSGLSLDTEMTVEEAKAMYRIITGACKQGTQAFVDGLGDRLKEKHTVREIIELTKGQYNAGRFEKFFSL